MLREYSPESLKSHMERLSKHFGVRIQHFADFDENIPELVRRRFVPQLKQRVKPEAIPH